jgi:hypothetical protein
LILLSILSQASDTGNFKESLRSLAGVLAIRHEPTRRRNTLLSSEPENDQQNDKKRGQHEPRDHDDLDPQLVNGGNVVVHIRILVKKSMAIAKDVRASHQIDQAKECGCDSKRRKNFRVNECQHDFRWCPFILLFSQASKAGYCRKSSDSLVERRLLKCRV